MSGDFKLLTDLRNIEKYVELNYNNAQLSWSYIMKISHVARIVRKPVSANPGFTVKRSNLFIYFFFLENPGPLKSSSLFWSCSFFSLLFLVVDLTRKGRTKCIVSLFDFSFSRPVQIRDNYLKVAQDIFWPQKLCFDERRLFLFLNGVHATWVSKNKCRTPLFFAVVKRF